MPSRFRVAVRVILLDSESRLLLFEGRDLSDESDTRRWWFTAGGGVDDGESLIEAARRELQEETGLSDLKLVGPFDCRQVEFLNHGEPTTQIEHFFAARTDCTTLAVDGWTGLEQQVVTTWRWWSDVELEAGTAVLFPENLLELVRCANDLV